MDVMKKKRFLQNLLLANMLKSNFSLESLVLSCHYDNWVDGSNEPVPGTWERSVEARKEESWNEVANALEKNYIIKDIGNNWINNTNTKQRIFKQLLINNNPILQASKMAWFSNTKLAEMKI
jgi:hypothetical protein